MFMLVLWIHLFGSPCEVLCVFSYRTFYHITSILHSASQIFHITFLSTQAFLVIPFHWIKLCLKYDFGNKIKPEVIIIIFLCHCFTKMN